MIERIQIEFLIWSMVATRLSYIWLSYQLVKWIKRQKNKKERLNMNTVEKLLKMDSGKLKMPEKDVVMKLKKLGNEEFTFPCRAVDPEIVAELQEDALEFNDGDLDKIKVYHTKVMTIVEGCPSVFKNQEVIKHFGAHTPKDLVKKLLLSGEMDHLNNEINALGGYDKKKKKDKEIKN